MEQTHEPVYTYRIGGIRCRSSEPLIAKSISIKGTGCGFGCCVRKAVEITSGVLPFVSETRLRIKQSVLTGRRKSAEGVVVTEVTKARTVARKGLMGERSKQRNS